MAYAFSADPTTDFDLEVVEEIKLKRTRNIICTQLSSSPLDVLFSFNLVKLAKLTICCLGIVGQQDKLGANNLKVDTIDTYFGSLTYFD